MSNKGKNIFFIITVVVLSLGIIQQGSLLIKNIGQSTTAFNNQSSVEVAQEEEPSKGEEVNKSEKKKSIFSNDFLKNILKKEIPMMELGYKIHGDEDSNLLSSLFAMTTNIDMKDPKTLLNSQIPLLETYEPDDVEFTVEDQKALHDELAQKPMNDENVVATNTSRGNRKVDNQDPLVLIYHTHTTESYTSTSDTNIDYVSPWRTLDESKNMARIGKEIQKILEDEYGVNVIHDTTVHDYPNYNVSYSRSLETAEKILKENPTIKYVFDIHRDGLAENNRNRENTVAVFGEEKTAKAFMVVGRDNFNADKNKEFAKKIEGKLTEDYPGITKPMVARDNRKYNQFVSDYAALIEVGSNLNTLEEALVTSEYIAHSIGKTIVELED